MSGHSTKDVLAVGISPEMFGDVRSREQSHCEAVVRKSTKLLRLRGGTIAAVCWALVVTAVMLTPDQSGYGTHEQLGLPPCSTLARTGYPCPTCGLTTAVSASAHGRLTAAVRAQPFGLIIFATVVLLGITATAEFVSGRDMLSRLRPRWWWLAAAAAGLLGGWGAAVAFGVASGIYPTH